MRKMIFFLFLFSLQCTPQVFAQSGSSTVRAEAGDIDMNQFKDLESPPERPKAESQIQVRMTCIDSQGVLIKKGDAGFETCMAQSQSRLMQRSERPEAPDDARKY